MKKLLSVLLLTTVSGASVQVHHVTSSEKGFSEPNAVEDAMDFAKDPIFIHRAASYLALSYPPVFESKFREFGLSQQSGNS